MFKCYQSFIIIINRVFVKTKISLRVYGFTNKVKIFNFISLFFIYLSEKILFGLCLYVFRHSFTNYLRYYLCLNAFL